MQSFPDGRMMYSNFSFSLRRAFLTGTTKSSQHGIRKFMKPPCDESLIFSDLA
jgi:hypothetical protein